MRKSGRNDYSRLIADELDKWKDYKQTILEIYKSSFSVEVQLPPEMNNWRFKIIVISRGRILKELFRNNLFASTHYASSGTMFNMNDCRTADQGHQNIINLFIDKY